MNDRLPAIDYARSSYTEGTQAHREAVLAH